MKKLKTLGSTLVILLSLAACQKSELPIPAADPTSPEIAQPKAGTTYGGQATGLEATVMTMQNGTVTSTQSILAQTPLLAASGGTQEASHGQATIPDVFTASSLSASITGQNNNTTSVASVVNPHITVGGNVISASYVQATASVACGVNGSGSSQINDLVVNGTSITVTGAPNQFVQLPNGSIIIINEQSSSKKGKLAKQNITGLHIIVPNVADVKVAAVRSEIKC